MAGKKTSKKFSSNEKTVRLPSVCSMWPSGKTGVVAGHDYDILPPKVRARSNYGLHFVQTPGDSPHLLKKESPDRAERTCHMHGFFQTTWNRSIRPRSSPFAIPTGKIWTTIDAISGWSRFVRTVKNWRKLKEKAIVLK